MKIGSECRARPGRTSSVVPAVLMVTLGCFGGDGADEVPRPSTEWAPETYVAYFVDTSLVMDGLLDDSAWAIAEWSADFVDIQGSALPRPRFRTRMKMLWGVDYLYIAAEMEEPHVWADSTRRDAVIFHDNDFEVFIDPDGDTHNYFELEINALGTEWDLLLLKPYRVSGNRVINSWDIQGLITAIDINGTINNSTDADGGWTVEIAIPWSVLGEAAGRPVPPGHGDQWRMNFSRVEWSIAMQDSGYVKRADPTTGVLEAEDNWVWSPQGLVNMHYPEMWGVVQFSDSLVGASLETVQIADREMVRHGLYQLYFDQRDWFARHGRYARTLSELGSLDEIFPGYQTPPTIEVTRHGFEITRMGPDGIEVGIDQDGRSWVTVP